jgi:hypothetical protein
MEPLNELEREVRRHWSIGYNSHEHHLGGIGAQSPGWAITGIPLKSSYDSLRTAHDINSVMTIEGPQSVAAQRGSAPVLFIGVASMSLDRLLSGETVLGLSIL